MIKVLWEPVLFCRDTVMEQRLKLRMLSVKTHFLPLLCIVPTNLQMQMIAREHTAYKQTEKILVKRV